MDAGDERRPCTLTSQQEAEGRAAAHALPEHLLQGAGLLVLMEQASRGPRSVGRYFHTDRGLFRAVDGIDFSVDRGKTVGLVGESGCGKSVTSLSVMGLVASPPGQVEADAVMFEGRDMLGLSADERRRTARQQDVDDLPGADDLAQPGPHDRPADRRGDPRAHAAVAAGGQEARHRDARAGAHPLGGRAHRRLPAPPVGRHAPARHDRHGARLRARAADRRRADHGARRHHPGADPRPAGRPAEAARHGDPDHHPRSRRDRRGGRRGDRHVRRQDRRERAGRGPVRRSAAPLHDRPAGLDPAPRRRARAAVDHRGHRAQPQQPAQGLPLLAALPVRRPAMPRGAAAARGTSPPATRSPAGRRRSSWRGTRHEHDGTGARGPRS